MLRNYYLNNNTLTTHNTGYDTQKFRFNYVKNNIDKKDWVILDKIENIINRLSKMDIIRQKQNQNQIQNQIFNVKIFGKVSGIVQNILKQYDIDMDIKKKYCGLKKYTLIKLNKFINNYRYIYNNEIKPISSKPIDIPIPINAYDEEKENERKLLLYEKQKSKREYNINNYGYRSRYSKR